jgi:hypothetical protein
MPGLGAAAGADYELSVGILRSGGREVRLRIEGDALNRIDRAAALVCGCVPA